MKTYNFFKSILFAALILFVFSCGEDNSDIKSTVDTTTKDSNSISFSGYKWKIINTKNAGDEMDFCLKHKSNVILKDGQLILKLTKIDGVWYGGEIEIDSLTGYGEYSFDCKTNQDGLDANAAFSFALVNETDENYEGMTQTGIRFSKYAEPEAMNELEYFLYATDKKIAEVQTPDNPFLLSGVVSSHKIGIYPNYLYYSSKASGGFYNEFKAMKNSASSTDLSDALTFSEPTGNLKVVISLCLPEMNEPADKKEIEVIISNFKYSPSVSDITKAGK